MKLSVILDMNVGGKYTKTMAEHTQKAIDPDFQIRENQVLRDTADELLFASAVWAPIAHRFPLRAEKIEYCHIYIIRGGH